ncbi:MAG: hypothetical protein HYS12_04505 [Planctomycetes bacterium]|nr:hypothetical protein [Planctomycetota bacterium]
MAFNPFHGFRKHSKVIFAILTIICMITFVLSFGRGDFFEWAVGLVGQSRKGDAVTTLYGKKVYDRDVQERRSHREIANELMRGVAQESVQPTMNRVEQELGKLYDGELSEELRLYREQLRDVYLRPYLQRVLFFGQAPETEGLLKFLLEKDSEAHDVFEMAKQAREGKSSQQTEQRLRRYLEPNPFGLYIARTRLLTKDRTEEARVLAGLMALDENEALRSPDPRMRVTYFDRSTHTQDLLDSLVWLHQADSLGIRLTEEGIRAEVNRISPAVDILTGDSNHDRELVQRIFANRDRRAQVDLAAVYGALGDELRIRLAKETILGEVPGQRPSLATLFRGTSVYQPFTGVTPGEYLGFYRDQRTSVKVTLLPLPVRAFVDDIPRQPTAKELEKLFEMSKGVESQPWSRTPGFRRPQKVGLQWIAEDPWARSEGTPHSTFEQLARTLPGTGMFRALEDPRRKHYENLAATILRIGGNPAPVPSLLGPGNPLPAWQLLGTASTLNTEYAGLKTTYPVPSLFGGDPALSYYTALNPPTVIAGTVAQMAPNGPLASYFSPLVTSQAAAVGRARVYKGGKLDKDYQAEAIKQEGQQRARVIASALGTSVRGPSLTQWAPWVWANYQEPRVGDLLTERFPVTPPLNSYVSPAGLRFQVLDTATRSLAQTLLNDDLDRLSAELKKKSDDREAFEKLLRETRKKYPWWDNYTGKTSQPVDRHAFLTAPELQPLRNIADVSPSQSPEEQVKQIEVFFQGGGKLYDPSRSSAKSGVVFWKTQDLPATTPSWGDDGIRQEVFEAWQMLEARTVAQQEAERIRAKINGKNADEALNELRRIAKEHPSWGTPIHLKDVARKVVKTDTQERFSKDYEAYKVPRDEIPYPPENFVDQLLELNERQAAFLWDRPEKHIYVVYVEKRSPPPSVEQVVEARRRELDNEKLWKDTKSKQQKAHQEAVLRELRREAGKLNAEGRFELRAGIRSDEGGSDRDGYND